MGSNLSAMIRVLTLFAHLWLIKELIMKIASICVSLINLILFLAETYLIVIIIMQMLMVVSLSLSLSSHSSRFWSELDGGCIWH